jgi:serine/threonine protein kinase
MEHYQKIKELSSGAFGKALLVSEKSTGINYCIKVTNFNKDNLTLDEVKKEFNLLMKFQHSNIVKVFDHFVDGNDFSIVMEYVDGGTLKEKNRISKSPF